MRHVALSVLIFGIAALVGPLLRFVTWPPSQFRESPNVFYFLYQLILLLWPAQPIAVTEVNTGPIVAGAIAVGANVLLFMLVGLVAGALSKWRVALLIIFICVSFAVARVSEWAFGDLTQSNAGSLITAFLFYAVLFWITDSQIRASKVSR